MLGSGMFGQVFLDRTLWVLLATVLLTWSPTGSCSASRREAADPGRRLADAAARDPARVRLPTARAALPRDARACAAAHSRAAQPLAERAAEPSPERVPARPSPARQAAPPPVVSAGETSGEAHAARMVADAAPAHTRRDPHHRVRRCRAAQPRRGGAGVAQRTRDHGRRWRVQSPAAGDAHLRALPAAPARRAPRPGRAGRLPRPAPRHGARGATRRRAGDRLRRAAVPGWAPWRMARYRRCVDLCLSILPFEVAFFVAPACRAKTPRPPAARPPRRGPTRPSARRRAACRPTPGVVARQPPRRDRDALARHAAGGRRAAAERPPGAGDRRSPRPAPRRPDPLDLDPRAGRLRGLRAGRADREVGVRAARAGEVRARDRWRRP